MAGHFFFSRRGVRYEPLDLRAKAWLISRRSFWEIVSTREKKPHEKKTQSAIS